MTILKDCNLRELIIGGMLEAREKVSEDFERASKIERHFYSDDDRSTMREQLAEYDAFLHEPDRWFHSLASTFPHGQSE
ncbi:MULTISPECIES: hypothetical protein [Thalassospira]|uniref:Uncharacterized protein n=1 Tax=Thalassospira profundimaris TaxID=502049 RepID=A0A367X4R4_9PROT|nr:MULTISPECIES: hypothetical protein [Thalassospira]MEE3046423.1 hypothetical protein [Pseudomonadota bacterium]HAI31619.1 hypothetical protein [Thalassospira sp.]KZC98697.1 hypothetical protein AUQ41_15235 [Thalassospira sp. MCCC 1A02898]ONH86811.1 hypothetical protein TH47_14460 [Thalassospira sp. MCCC 1A02803]RCK47741.1 hypothetical protein TH30_04575 [Thalassospira profundimaris]